MTDRPEETASDQDQVASAYRQMAAQSSPSSQLDAQVFELANTHLEQSRQQAEFKPTLLAAPPRILMGSAALVLIAVAGVALLVQEPTVPQPVSGTTSKSPTSLPPIPAIKAPLLVPKSERAKSEEAVECQPDTEPPCPPMDPPAVPTEPQILATQATLWY
ncbi:MAG: hypothetical protein V3R81_15775 [Gammaproteobacteria bacterium]